MSTTSNNNNSNISNNNDEVSPLTKLKQGVKKKAESWEEDIVKSMEHAKDKLTTIRTTTTTTTARSNDHQQQRPSTTSTIPSAKTTTTSTSATKSLPVPGEGGEEMATNNNAYNQPTSSSTTTAAATTTTTTTTTMTTSSNNATSSSSSSVSILVLQLLLVTIISISTVYHTWLYQLDILVNHIPVIVAVHWILLAYFIGSSSSSSSDGVKVVFVPIQDNDQDAKHQEEEDDDQEDDAVLLDHTNNEEESSNHHHHVVVRQNEAKVKAAAATKQLLRRIPMGRRHYAKMKAVYLQGLNNKSSTSSSSSPVEEFFTNLKPVGFITTTTTTKSPISEKMMNRLLKYPDFRKRKSLKGEIDMTPLSREGSSSSSDSSLQEEEEEEEELLRLSSDENEEGEEGERKTKKERMGTAPLVNLRASKLERDFDYVEPLCEFRGMDFFLGDYPEKEIWKQPLLLKNGLRDAATIIGNLMLPHGNLTSYLQMPDWFDDWDNIPEEMEEDPPDVKALKRFFSGDLEYQRKRAKIVPMVVKAPYVVKIIAPNACEMTMHTPRHPVNIKKVNKVVDPSTGETSAAALMEVCVDFYTSAAIGRIINIVMPHLGSITIDVALVIAPPWGAEGAEANEPSACIGVWRIDKVDFMSCAQLPEQPMKVVEEEIKEIMKSLALEENSKLNI